MTSHRPSLSRRGFCLCCLGASTFVATGGWLSPRQVFAKAQNIVDLIRDDAAKAEIIVHPLRRNVFVLEGSGGNVGVLNGSDGKVLIDAGITASKPRITEALASFGPEPISHLINTHWHFDHTDGNAWLNGAGATIMAHENTRKHLLMTQRVEDWDFDFPASPAGAIPTDVFAETKSLQVNRTTLSLKHYAPAHTDSDISVYLEEADILHAGDTYWNGSYPFIDYSTGGSTDGSIKAAVENVEKASKETIVIPGHGPPVSDKTGLIEFRDMLITIRDNVSRLKRQGKGLEETIAAQPTRTFDAKWGQFVATPPLFTRLVYEGV